MGGIECYWWKFWRRLRALTEQLPRPVALAGAFEVPTGGTALRVPNTRAALSSFRPGGSCCGTSSIVPRLVAVPSCIQLNTHY
jgi:hypothetical protein